MRATEPLHEVTLTGLRILACLLFTKIQLPVPGNPLSDLYIRDFDCHPGDRLIRAVTLTPSLNSATSSLSLFRVQTRIIAPWHVRTPTT
jgi:hypothetical protein